MATFLHALNVLLPLIYGLSLFLYIGHFNSRKPQLGKSASVILLIGVVIHAVYIVGKGLYYQYFPISNTLESLSMLGLNIAVLYYIIERTVKEGSTGLFFLSIVFLFQLVASMFINGFGTSNQLLSNPMFGFHTTLTLLGISALAISALYGLMYLMLAKEIKRHHFGAIYDGLPSLETIEKMGMFATGFGIIFLGLGVLLGHLWAFKILGYFFKLDPKIIITDIAWVTYAVGWIVSRRMGLRGLRMSRITFWGFVIFFISTIIASMFTHTFHRFI
jgi:ABC-type uncharacterized transport system permease subunit